MENVDRDFKTNILAKSQSLSYDVNNNNETARYLPIPIPSLSSTLHRISNRLSVTLS